tara:strand:+ start:561 stop:863 length:303 start_codon:yes stop_codon:yes gene_type:complete
MKERLLWVMLLSVIVVAAHTERSRCLGAYNEQHKTLTKLSLHHYEVKKELQKSKKEVQRLQKAGQELYGTCRNMASKCKDIIEKRLNCRPMDYLRRNNTL